MRIGKLKIVLLALCCLALGFEIWRLWVGSRPVQQAVPSVRRHKPDFVLLPEAEAATLGRFFAGPKAKIEGWEPTVADMNDVEANLGQIAALSIKDPDTSRHVDDPASYFRQYGAVTIDGRKAILLNAFCPLGQEQSDRWRRQAIVANDGGKCYWRALFDVSTQKFTLWQ